MNKSKIALFLVCMVSGYVNSQITSPGIGRNNAAAWFAAGVRQDLDSTGHKELMTYVGFGRSTQPNSYNLVQRPAIFVVNEEFHHRFARHWQYGIGLSYRRQNLYEKSAPYSRLNPSIMQEIRFYGRISYVYELPRTKFTFTLREEMRNFFEPDFSTVNKNIQLRTRVRAQVKFNLDRRRVHRIELSAEPLFASQHKLSNRAWSNMDYTETRFTCYYSYAPRKIPFVFDIGYMNYLVGKTKAASTHYIGIDVVWNNPFGKPHKSKAKPVEYLE